MIKNLLDDNDNEPPVETKPSSRSTGGVISLFDSDDVDSDKENEPFVLSESPPESMADTVRRSGLAWSAGVAFFGAVVFMLILGWGADLLLGTAPWGIVGGIVFGSIIGFVQFFR